MKLQHAPRESALRCPTCKVSGEQVRGLISRHGDGNGLLSHLGFKCGGPHIVKVPLLQQCVALTHQLIKGRNMARMFSVKAGHHAVKEATAIGGWPHEPS